MHLGLIAILAVASLFASDTIHVNKDFTTTIKPGAAKQNAKAEYKVNP